MSELRIIKIWKFLTKDHSGSYALQLTLHPENYLPDFVAPNSTSKLRHFQNIVASIEIERSGDDHLTILTTNHLLIFTLTKTDDSHSKNPNPSYSMQLKTHMAFKNTNCLIIYDANENILINDGRYLYNYTLENETLQALIKIDGFIDREFDPYCYGYGEDVIVYTMIERNVKTDEVGFFEIWVPRKTKKFVGCEMQIFGRGVSQAQVLPGVKGDRILKGDVEGKGVRFGFHYFDS
jgi:hypothetical protein